MIISRSDICNSVSGWGGVGGGYDNFMAVTFSASTLCSFRDSGKGGTSWAKRAGPVLRQGSGEGNPPPATREKFRYINGGGHYFCQKFNIRHDYASLSQLLGRRKILHFSRISFLCLLPESFARADSVLFPY